MARNASTSRDDLLEAASALMRERDTLDVSLSEIAKRAKVNSALVKYYFGNKEGMMFALLERDLTGAIRDLNALMATGLSPAEKMQRHLTGIVRLYFRYPYINRLLLALIRDVVPARARALTQRYVQPIADAQRQIVDEGVRLGQFRDTDSRMLYFLLVGACDYIFAGRQSFNYLFDIHRIDEKLRDRYVTQLVEIVMSGLATTDARA